MLRRQNMSFVRGRKSFSRPWTSFVQGGKSFSRPWTSFVRGGKSFSRPRTSFVGLGSGFSYGCADQRNYWTVTVKSVPQCQYCDYGIPSLKRTGGQFAQSLRKHFGNI